MIIADTNVIAYLFIEGDYTAKAKELLKSDPIWLSPFLWRSEFRNVLRLYMCQNYLSVEDAQNIMNEAEKFIKNLKQIPRYRIKFKGFRATNIRRDILKSGFLEPCNTRFFSSLQKPDFRPTLSW